MDKEMRRKWKTRSGKKKHRKARRRKWKKRQKMEGKAEAE